MNHWVMACEVKLNQTERASGEGGRDVLGRGRKGRSNQGACLTWAGLGCFTHQSIQSSLWPQVAAVITTVE